MDHLAILTKQRNLLAKILSGEKTIESRWYKSKFPPWNRIAEGDSIYFKETGDLVKAKAKVNKVLQFTPLTQKKVETLLKTYGEAICLESFAYTPYYDGRNYCILIFLENVQEIEPFAIDKTGYGNAAAWLCLKNIDQIKR